MKINSAMTLLAAATAFSLASCASPDTAKGAAKEGVQVQKAIEAPLADLNLVQEKIPPVLQAAIKAPYALPAQRACPDLVNEVRALDGVLGADLDTPPTVANPGLVERGTNMVGADPGAIDALTSKLLPVTELNTGINFRAYSATFSRNSSRLRVEYSRARRFNSCTFSQRSSPSSDSSSM